MRISASGLLVCFALWGSNAAAGTILPEVTVTTLFEGQQEPTTTNFFLQFGRDGKTFDDTFTSADYSWSFSGNIDPILNWGFVATTPGAYTVTFFMPVVGGPYFTLRNQASTTISDIGGGSSPSSISGTTIDGQVPAGTSIPAVKLTGNTSASNGGFAFLAYGPLTTNQNFGSPGSMAEVLSFTFSSPDLDGAVGFVGQLRLEPKNIPLGAVPEPASLTLVGLGVLGLWSVRRRTRNKSGSGR